MALSECGEQICCHNGLCLNCSLDKLRQNRKLPLGGGIMKKRVIS